jgi:hypothetical protein
MNTLVCVILRQLFIFNGKVILGTQNLYILASFCANVIVCPIFTKLGMPLVDAQTRDSCDTSDCKGPEVIYGAWKNIQFVVR